MLAYYDGTGNKTVLDFLVRMFSNYTAADSTSDRSLTQIETLLETHAYGGPYSLVNTALDMMKLNPTATRWLTSFINDPDCFNSSVLDKVDKSGHTGVCAHREQ